MSDKQSTEDSKTNSDNWDALQSLFLETKGKQPNEGGKSPLDNWDVLQSLFDVNQQKKADLPGSDEPPNHSNPNTEKIQDLKKQFEEKLHKLNIKHGELDQKLDNKYKEMSDKLDQVYEDIKRSIEVYDTKVKDEIIHSINGIYEELKKAIDVHYAKVESKLETNFNQISSKFDQTNHQTQRQIQEGYQGIRNFLNSFIKGDSLKGLNSRTLLASLASSILISSAISWWISRPTKPIFSDISKHWAAEFIEELAKKEVIKGFPDGTFRPDSKLTRAEYAAILTKAFNLPPSKNIKKFQDVKPDFWAYDAIQTNYARQFLKGFPDNTFRPQDKVQRVQVIAALVSGSALTQVKNSQVLSFYTDSSSIPSWSKAAVITATANELVVNYPDIKQLNPTQSATRAEVVVMIYQSMVKAKKISPIKSSYIVSNELQKNK